jgi:hypothetical protein
VAAIERAARGLEPQELTMKASVFIRTSLDGFIARVEAPLIWRQAAANRTL